MLLVGFKNLCLEIAQQQSSKRVHGNTADATDAGAKKDDDVVDAEFEK